MWKIDGVGVDLLGLCVHFLGGWIGCCSASCLVDCEDSVFIARELQTAAFNAGRLLSMNIASTEITAESSSRISLN